tara:strand:- start:11705 stop:12130 length:426 start_codon:yes stop_codon:yes gene_type:complete
MHRTLKQDIKHNRCSSMAAQQKQFDLFRNEYNQYRPHESLKQSTPASHYNSSQREYPDKLPEITYPNYLEVKKVRDSGVVYWNNGQVYISHLLADEWIGMEEIDDGVWDIYFGPIRIGSFNQRESGSGRTPYWSIKCNPCI